MSMMAQASARSRCSRWVWWPPAVSPSPASHFILNGAMSRYLLLSLCHDSNSYRLFIYMVKVSMVSISQRYSHVQKSPWYLWHRGIRLLGVIITTESNKFSVNFKRLISNLKRQYEYHEVVSAIFTKFKLSWNRTFDTNNSTKSTPN